MKFKCHSIPFDNKYLCIQKYFLPMTLPKTRKYSILSFHFLLSLRQKVGSAIRTNEFLENSFAN